MEARRLIIVAALAIWTEEGPVAGRDGLVVLPDRHGHRAREDVEGELLDPLVPVALVELGAVLRVAEQPGPLAHLGPQRLVEGSEAAGSKLLPGARVPVVDGRGGGRGELAQHRGSVLHRPGHSCHASSSCAQLLPSPRLVPSSSWSAAARGSQPGWSKGWSC